MEYWEFRFRVSYCLLITYHVKDENFILYDIVNIHGNVCLLLLTPFVQSMVGNLNLRGWVSQFSPQSCPTLCDPVDCCMPGFPVHHQHSCPLSQWCHPTISSSVVSFSFCLQSFPASGSFQMSQFCTSVGQSIEVSTSASVLPMNIQDWFPLGWTGWIFLQPKGFSRLGILPKFRVLVKKH